MCVSKTIWGFINILCNYTTLELEVANKLSVYHAQTEATIIVIETYFSCKDKMCSFTDCASISAIKKVGGYRFIISP